MKKIFKNQSSGITLIALVVTIVVLLILATVSIQMLGGENGIIKQAQNAKEETIIGQEQEQVEMAYVSAAVNKLGDTVTDGDLQIELNKSVGTTKTLVTPNSDGTLNVLFYDTDHNYNVNNGTVEKVEPTEKQLDLETGTIKTINTDTNKIMSEEKVAILKTMKIPSYSTDITEIYFVDTGDETDPQKYLVDTYGIESANTENVSYNDNCLPVYIGWSGTVYYVASQGNTYLNSEENGGGYALFGNTSISSSLGYLTKLDLSNLNTTYATDMSCMFGRAGWQGNVLQINYGENFDTSNVTNMRYMFYGVGIKEIILPDKFDTSNVTDMQYMFYSYLQSVIERVDLGNKFDTSNVTNMSHMFMSCGCNYMTSLDLGDKFDTSKVTNMDYMFKSCGESLMTSFELGNKFDTSNVTSMWYMFNQCGMDKMTSLNLGSKFNTTKVTNMSYMFYQCGSVALTEIIYGGTTTEFETNCGNLKTNSSSSYFNASNFSNWENPYVTCSDGNYAID